MIPPLYPHQLTALDRLNNNDNYALLLDLGLGKSRIIIEDFLRRPNIDLLVVAPSGVFLNWRLELQKYTEPNSIDIVHWKSGGSKKDMESVSRIVKKSTRRRAFLMNVEALSTVKLAKKAMNDFLDSGDVMMVIDESTKIRGYNSARTKTVIDLGQKAKYRRILSGLITPKSPMDLFSQFQFLNWRILGYRNFFSFRARYAITKRISYGGRKFEQIVGYKNIEELQQKIAPFSYRALKKDCISLPEKIYLERSVELSEEQKKIYKELAQKAATVLQGGEFVTSTTAIDMLQRLHAVTYGHVRDDTGEIREVDASPRDQQLLEAIEESNGKVIIWANFRHTLARLIKLLKDEYGKETVVDYWGDTSSEDRVKAVDRFQNDPTCRFFVSNPSTGGMGITLTEASTVVFYANSFDLEHRAQSEDRAHRIGQKNNVVYIDLVSQGTIDEKILKALRNKINLAATITGEVAREWIR